MALVVFLRGVNVGGHRTFRPSQLTKELRNYDVVNIGAAGTFVVRKPGPSKAKFRAALLAKLPFATEAMICDGREILALEAADPFKKAPRDADARFVSVMAKDCPTPSSLPISLPSEGRWLVQIIGVKARFLLGVYRRDMKTIRYLGELDKLFGGKATTRNWNTMLSVANVLKSK